MSEHEEKALKLVAALAEKKAKEDKIKAEYTEKAKIKKLTEAQRIERIEKILGID